MTREQLEHAIRAACDVVDDHEVYVFGSQSILGQFPEVPPMLKMSAEADISPRNRLDRVEHLNAIGEDSPFHLAHGFYVHGLPIHEAATLPTGWEERTIVVRATENATGLCLEGHDLGASKLVAFRDKDREFVLTLLAEGFLSSTILVERIWCLPVSQTDRERIARWVHLSIQEL
ncbi:MAG: hypothetical protein C0516_07540 [Gemmatimonas sp.]|nr:hypothetical protein [Gemmatimonas sp.]